MRFFKKLGNFFISRKFIINFVLICLAWVGVLFGGRYYFGSYTDHGVKTDVPNLLNNNAKDISALIGNRPLKYEILDSIYNPDLVEGTVIYQNPMPTDSSGLSVKPDRIIQVRVSKATKLVKVPIVRSKSERFALTTLRIKGLRTKINYVPSSEDQGSVMEQKYKGKEVTPNLQVPINSLIELTVGKRGSGDLVAVPNLIGLTIKEAQERLEGGVHLKLYSICNNCFTQSDSLNAFVTRQTPIAADSAKITAGSIITVFASPNGE